MIAGVYCRKSTEQTSVTADQKSVARQIEHACAYAARKGWRVADEHVYVDDGISGAEFANRPGLARLLNALKPRAPFQFLVISDLDRLGREQLETGYVMKQIAVGGVRVFSYLEDREIAVDSSLATFMMQVQAFGASLEREKARQRTRDAMVRKAEAGHVTGGQCFGYRNVTISGPDGRRSHVERVIEPAEAEIVRRIFRLSAEGFGLKAIVKLLNAEGASSPRAQLGRARTWAPSSVRAVLHRPIYRGEVVWAQTAKRDTWGRTRPSARPETDWIRRPAPALRIVDDAEWDAAHARIVAARGVYFRSTNGERFGRPTLNNPSKYLLTNMALCGVCGGTLHVVSRSHGASRKRFYGCSAFHERGTCTNRADVPIADADDVLLEALLDDVLDPTIVRDAADEAIRLLRDDGRAERLDRLDAELAALNRERDRIVAAIAAGGDLPGLVDGLRTRETRRAALEVERDAVRAQAALEASAIGTIRGELLDLAQSWRRVLADDPTHARPIVSSLLRGRVTFTPLAPLRWQLRGAGHLTGLFEREMTGRGYVPNSASTLPVLAFTREFRAA